MDKTTLPLIISELEVEIQKLVRKNVALKNENATLKKQLEKTASQDDLFGSLSTNERISMKAKVDHLLKKIDQQILKSEQA